MCKILARTKNMPRKDWLNLRRQGIGGSDAGAVCGLNPYASAMDVYISKKGEKPEQEDYDNEAMKQGRDFEDYVAKRFSEATGLKVRRSNAVYANEEHPFMIADVDRMLVGHNIGLECKTASPYSANKWKDGHVPAHYLIQCYHYMAVLDADAWYIAVLIYGREFNYVKVERDEEIIQNLIQIEEKFWKDYVVPGILPEPDGSSSAEKFINGYFKESMAESKVPLLGFDEKLRRRMEIEELTDKLELEVKKIDQEIKVYMKDAEMAESENFLVSWKNVLSSRIDSKRLKKEMPEIYEKYTTPVMSRRFQVKAV